MSYVLLGSLFGLNLFAGFMCDTFYSLQGTEQLEEVQWLGVKNILKRNQPRRIRTPPGNFISSACREVLLSTWWQNFSAGCLLLNVAFMASAQAEQSDETTRIINIQNDVFFGVLCLESFLNLTASGPIIFISTPSNQFDIFLIVATSTTMVLGEGLRSMSQAVRILRLSKFLQALSKNPTIAAVFETVAISMPQVVNIVIVMCVVLLIMAALAVQLFGLVRPGQTVGLKANFKNFQNSLHTCFQLMFGEDLWAITDDCVIEQPLCTPSIPDPNNPREDLIPTDCGAGGISHIFFVVYQVLIQYVMLNLFVGMIMNNFAFITTRDGNGVVSEENFVDLAYTWAVKFDPNITTMIRLEQVLPYFHAIGAPLGHFGDKENNGRFLCVRQELKRKLLEEVDTPFQGGWFYRNIYCSIKEKEETLHYANVSEWRSMNQNLQKLESIFVAEAEEQGDYDAMRRMNIQPKKRYTVDGNEKSDTKSGDGDHEEESEDSEEETQAQPMLNDDVLSDGHFSDRDDEYDSFKHVNGQGHHVAGSNMGGTFEPPTFRRPVWQRETDEGDQGRLALVRGQSMTVSGQNMGMGGAAKNQGRVQVKKVKRKISNYEGVDKYLDGKHNKVDPLEVARKRLESLESQLVALRQQALEMESPRPTVWMRFWALLALACESIFLTYEERIPRKKGHVFFNEVIMALMYWNKARNIVPSKLQQARKDLDEAIITDVAFQLIHGLIRGGIVRRRNRLRRMRVQNRFNLAKDHAQGKNKGLGFIRGVMTAKQRIIMEAQNEYASPVNLERLAADAETRPLLQLIIRMVNTGLVNGSQLALEAEEAGKEMGKVGIFTLEEHELQEVFSNSKNMRSWVHHVNKIERLQWLITAAPNHGPSVIRLAAEKHHLELGGYLERLATLPLVDLLNISEDPYVVQVLSAMQASENHENGHEGHTAAQVEARRHELIAEYTSKIHNERIHLDRIEEEADERRMILKESRNRMGHFEREIAGLQRAQELQERRRRRGGQESSSDCPTESEAEMSADGDETGERGISLPGATESPVRDGRVSPDCIWSQDAIRVGSMLPLMSAPEDGSTRAHEVGARLSADENEEDDDFLILDDDQLQMLDVDASTDANSPNTRAYNWIDQQSPLSGEFRDQEEAIRQMHMRGERAEMQPAAGGALRPLTAAPYNSTAPSKSQQKARPSTAVLTPSGRPPTGLAVVPTRHHSLRHAVGVGVSVRKLGAYSCLEVNKYTPTLTRSYYPLSLDSQTTQHPSRKSKNPCCLRRRRWNAFKGASVPQMPRGVPVYVCLCVVCVSLSV
jgi:hypothetical protein